MCYSSQIVAEWKKYVRHYGVQIDVQEYFNLFWRRQQGEKIKTPKALDESFLQPETDDERKVAGLIAEWRAGEAMRFEQELFKQRRRLADAQRALAEKPTKKAAEDERISGNKAEQLARWLGDLKRTQLEPQDSRIYPQHYAHVIVWHEGRRVLMPMRYGCRPAGKPAFYDTKYPGCYNSRKESLEGFWRQQFGRDHAIMVADAFYENVQRDGKNVVLEFRPDTRAPMLVACLWSRWTKTGEPDLLSFSAITDEPPPEVAAAGHDRCIIPIRPENVDSWLRPDPANLAASYAVLDDRERPYYEHRLAA